MEALNVLASGDIANLDAKQKKAFEYEFGDFCTKLAKDFKENASNGKIIRDIDNLTKRMNGGNPSGIQFTFPYNNLIGKIFLVRESASKGNINDGIKYRIKVNLGVNNYAGFGVQLEQSISGFLGKTYGVQANPSEPETEEAPEEKVKKVAKKKLNTNKFRQILKKFVWSDNEAKNEDQLKKAFKLYETEEKEKKGKN